MATQHSSSRRTSPKPHPDLWLHPSGRWCKKIKGRAFYFGKADDPPTEVAQRYLRVRDDLLAGRTPRAPREGLTVRNLVNRFLTAKRALVDTGELVERTWVDYYKACERVIAVSGPDRLASDLDASDFGRLRKYLAKGQGAVTLGNMIQRVRMLFKWGYDEGLLVQPIRYGQSFKRPSRKALRQARHRAGKKLFTPEEVQAMIDAAGVHLRAMIYLGINAAMGNSDVGTLPRKAINLKAGWLDYPRPKTAVPRRVPLWPQTVAALAASLEARPKPRRKAHAGLFFLTRTGEPWAKESPDNPVSKETAKLLRRLGIQGARKGFYTLRHTFRTVADAVGDTTAVRVVMGHAESASDMDAAYIEEVPDERLWRVTDHVRQWLYGCPPSP